MQKQKKTTLTESQVKLKKYLKPIVEGILTEVESPITKKFIPFSQEKPPSGKPLFLIDHRGSYCVGYYNQSTDKLSDVGTPFNKHQNIGTEFFTHWAV